MWCGDGGGEEGEEEVQCGCCASVGRVENESDGVVAVGTTLRLQECEKRTNGVVAMVMVLVLRVLCGFKGAKGGCEWRVRKVGTRVMMLKGAKGGRQKDKAVSEG